MKKKVLILAMIMLIVVGSYFVAGTYAKYTSNVSGESTASIAGWKWAINDKDLKKDIIDANETKYVLDLFTTVKDSDGNNEDDVALNNIAPGTKGSFDIKIKNESQVNAVYSYKLSVDNNLGANLVWSTDGQNYVNDISQLNVNNTRLNIGSAEDIKTIYWKWIFEDDSKAVDTTEDAKKAAILAQDQADTTVGFNAANSDTQDIKVTAVLTLTQVD